MKFITATMTKEELLNVIEDCQAELNLRKEEEKTKLISDFENAFYALKDAHIDIRYTDYQQEAYKILIDDMDNFDFDG